MTRRCSLLLILIISINLLSVNRSSAQNRFSNNSSGDTLTRKSEKKILERKDSLNKYNLTGNKLTIGSDRFNKGFIISPIELIAGKIPGLSISSQNGSPGSLFTISNLNNTSLVFGSGPLVIVDNMPLIGTSLSINPNDIESFAFLKDGVSAGIFGGQSPNGVLFINTRQGGERLKVTYTGKFAVSYLQNKTDVFSADEYRDLINNVYAGTPDAISMLGSVNTDWQNQIYRAAYGTDQHLSLSGSVIKMPFRIALGKTIQQGILKTSEFDCSTASLALSPVLFDNHLKIRMNLEGIFNNERIAEDAAVKNAILFDPSQPVYNNDGTYFQWPSYDIRPNPVAQLDLTDDRLDTKRWMWNINMDYRVHFFPDLRIIFYTGSDYMNSRNNNLTDANSLFQYQENSGKLTKSDNSINNRRTSLYLNYSRDLKFMSTTVGITIGASELKSAETQKINQTSALVPSVLYISSLSHDGYNQMSEFGKLDIAIKGKYSLAFNLCRDGYSVFIDPNKMHLFPSFSFEWNIKNEPLMKADNVLTGLKLYTGYGISAAFQPYSIPYGFSTHTQGDFDLEKISSFNAGLFYGFLNDRIQGRINYTTMTGNNMWSLYAINYDQIILNGTKITNNSIDLSIDALLISKSKLSWKIGYNISFNKNRVLAIPGNFPYGVAYNWIGGLNGGNIYIMTKGYPVNSFFVNKQSYDQSGKPIEGQFVDLSGTGGAIYGNRADMYRYHSSNPLALMGISSDLTFKNWEFAFSGRISLGNYLFNSENASSSLSGLYRYYSGLQNSSVLINDSKFVNPWPISDYFVENASFFRMDFVKLGYRFKTVSQKFPDISLSAVLQNAFIITGFKGQDPEIASGISDYNYPRPRTASLEVTFDF